jgi:hypothetical protein
MEDGMLDATASWVDTLVSPLQFVSRLRERRQALRTCVEALRLYHEVEASFPQDTGMARYERVVALHTGADARTVQKIIRGAEDSFASWPVERPLNFRDVVQYLAFNDYLKSDPSAHGATAHLTSIVKDLIPDDL